MHYGFFVPMGALCLFVALAQAWVLVVLFASATSPLSKLIPGRQDLLRSHIDYLMMALFLFAFYLLARALALSPPAWVVAATCIGAFFNPFAFMVRAFRPDYVKQPALPFTLMISLSCILTTVGFAAVAWMAARAALASGAP